MTAVGIGQRLKVFISYSRKDGAFAEDLLLALEAAGFEPYLDKHDIVAGEPWEERLDRLIQAADTVVFIISPDSMSSERVGWEISRTEDLGKRIIPVVWREVAEADTPQRLKRLNYVFFSGEGRSFGRGLNALAKALNTDIDWIREHTAYAEQAMRWAGKGRAEALLLRGVEIGNAKAWAARRPKDAPEPTLLQQEFVAESEKAEQARIAFEKAQAEAMKNAELDKVRAEQESDKLRLEVLERQRRQWWILVAGLVIVASLGGGFLWREWQYSEERRIAAEELAASQEQIQDLSQQLANITQDIAKTTDTGRARPPSDSSPGREPDDRDKGDRPPLQAPPLSGEELRKLVSSEAIDLMIAMEVGTRESYEAKYAKPSWPGLSSGVTIGFTFDLGYHTLDTFKSVWGGHLKADELERLSAAIGKKGEAAAAMVADFADINVSWEAAREVFLNTDLPRFAKLVISVFPNARELPPDSFGALVSLVYNRGPSLTGEKRTEMRNIRDLMETREFDKVPDQIRAMKRLWPASMSGLHKRRDAEAALFEKGLLEAARDRARAVQTRR